MPRLPGIPTKKAGLLDKPAYFFHRRALVQLSGREPERILESVEVVAHAPGVLRTQGKLEQANAKLRRLPKRIRGIAEMKAATLVHCEFCIDLGSQILRQWGVTDDELLALPNYRTSDLFSEVDKLVLDYAVGLSRTPAAASDDLFDQLRAHFDEEQLVEITHAIALGKYRGRFNVGLDIGAAGFSEGMVCAIPELPQPAVPEA